MHPSAVVVRDRYVLNLGADCKDGSAGYVQICVHGSEAEAGCALRPNYGPDTRINASCLPLPSPTPVGYCNGVTVFDTATKRWGSVRSVSSSEGAALVPPGCPQNSGLPYNGYNPNVAMHGDRLLVHSGESAPFRLKGVNYWHYPVLALSADVTVNS